MGLGGDLFLSVEVHEGVSLWLGAIFVSRLQLGMVGGPAGPLATAAWRPASGLVQHVAERVVTRRVTTPDPQGDGVATKPGERHKNREAPDQRAVASDE